MDTDPDRKPGHNRTEEALRESEERFRTAFEFAPIGMALVAPDGRWLRVNQSLCRIVGYSEEELLAKDFQSITHPDDLPTDLIFIRRLLDKSIQNYYREKRYLHKMGGIVWISLSVALVRGDDGRPLYFISQIQDITERKRADEELRLSEARYRAVVENQTEFIVRWRPDGSRTFANEAYRRYFGLTLKEAASASFLPLVAEADRAAVQAKMSRLLSGAVQSEMDTHRVIRQDGSIGWQEWVDQAVRDEAGRILEFQSVGRDITERRKAEEDLRLSEERFAKAFHANPEPISIYRDRDGVLLEVNDRWTSVFGYSREEAIGRTALELHLISPEHRQRLRALLEAGGPVRDHEIILKSKQGDTRHVSLSSEHIVIHGEPCNIFLHRDVTEYKKAEQQLRAISEQLRALTASVTSAREEEGIRIAREIHDELGSALTSLRWDLEGIDRMVSEPKDDARLRSVREKIASMMRLTETTVGAVRRISSELRPRVLDDLGLKEAIEWHAQQFQNQRGIACRCDCTQEDLTLSQEQATAVFRIYQEAMTNVLRHARATRVDIVMEEAGAEFIVTIADNGRGIREEQKSGLRSLGILGMQERAHLVGGEVDIRGMEGKGTVVTVRIPVQTEDASP